MPKMNITTKPLSDFSVKTARVSFWSAVLFFILFFALHFLEPEFDPSWRFISEYELGRYGFLMSIAFLSLMVSSVSLFVAILSQIRTVGGYIGLFFLLVSAVAFGMAGVFITDPLTATTATAHGRLHNTAAILGGNITGAAYFLGWSLARNKAWAKMRKSILWITFIAIGASLSSFWMQGIMAQSGNKFGPTVLVGWPNRLLIIGLAGWLLATAWRVMTMRSAK
ncbi:DUF998 domain-containing protein [Candidatus Roizmanbacteria bacterium]|nr:DUF998 domain-containing protein [Candidatus Roizmanbacteria bacterium]